MQQFFISDDLFNVESEGDILKIFFGARLIITLDQKNIFEIRRFIIQLVNMGVTSYRISKIFKIDKNTINNWYKLYKEKGMSVLDEIKKGPKKITLEIISYIIAKFKELNFKRNYKTIICEKVKEHFNIKIHWSSVAKILTKNGIDLSVKKNNKKLEVDSKEDESNKKQKEIENAGLFFIFPFLKKIDIKKLLEGVGGIFKNKYFSALDYLYMLILLFTSNMIKVEENIKIYENMKIGTVIGKNKIPSLRSVRENLPKIIEKIDIEKFQFYLCENYFKKNEDCNEIYIDGHFMPYYGFINTFKNFNPIRRFAMNGRIAYFLNNSNGRPFFYILSDGYKDFREYLYEISKKIKNIIGRKNKKEIIMIFDRGGYGEEFLEKFSKKIIFICWKTGKLNLPDNPKWKKIIIQHKGNNYNEYIEKEIEVCETIEEIKGSKKVKRFIWIKNGDKISPAFSNDKNRSLKELVVMLTKRWGVQENIFKPLKEIGIDKISSYKVESYPENWLLEEESYREVNNPQIIIFKDRIKILKEEIKKLKEKIGTKVLRAKNKVNIEKIKVEIIDKEDDKKKLKEEINKLPEKISITELIEAKNIFRLNSEKKKFFDILKVLSYNVQQDIVDLIRPIYNNERDVNIFVRSLLRGKGEVEINDKKIEIKFNKFQSKNKTCVLKFLCDKVNVMNIIHPLLNKKMVFDVI